MTRTVDHLHPAAPIAAGPRRLCELLDAIFVLYAELDLRQLLRSVLHHAVDLADARDGEVAVFDDNLSRVALLVTLDDTGSISARARSGQHQLFEVLGSDPRPTGLASVRRHSPQADVRSDGAPTTAFLSVPIWSRDIVFGNLCLTGKLNAEVFSDVDEQLVIALAAAAGLAVGNIERHGRLAWRTDPGG